MAIPATFICPITQEIMRDPVICSDGHSYEREAILRWLSQHNTSPMTNVVINGNIVPNHSLRNTIQEYERPQSAVSHTIPSQQMQSCNIQVTQNNANILAISCEDLKVKNPVDFVFAIDNSASMGDSAGIQGDRETQCYSRLDLVKHAALCIIESLGPDDTLGIVEYSSAARVIYQRSPMTDANKTIAINQIKNIQLSGATNLWDGLKTSLALTECSNHASPAVLLFTDGQPTAGDQQVDRAYSRYLSNNKLKTHLYTFGFSNEVNSQLLNTLADQGNGQFHFISDSAMIFTTIINFLANYYTMYGDVIINSINYGQLYYGQTKYIKCQQNPNVVLHNFQGNIDNYIVTSSSNTMEFGNALDITLCNIDTVIYNCNQHNFSSARQGLDSLINRLRNYVNDQRITDLIENICDQIYMAASENYYRKWGKHYLYSFKNAIRNQINNNFKDRGVQHFGGAMFLELQDHLNNIVANVTPPPPSRTYRGQTYTVSSMSSFNDRSNPCFAGYNKVKMAFDDSFKYVKDIKFGDRVWTPFGTATVTLVVKTLCKDNLTELSKVGNLSVTPWHPIKYQQEWCFPNELSSARLTQCEAVYSFVLDKHHIMNIEDFDVICLAHGYKDSILAHEFWGTQKVINSLKQKDGFSSGLVTLKSGCLMNDPQTGLVCAL